MLFITSKNARGWSAWTQWLAWGISNNSKLGNISEYVENLIKSGAKKKKVDSFGTEKIECDEEIYALGVNPETKKLKKKRIKHFIYILFIFLIFNFMFRVFYRMWICIYIMIYLK